MPVYIVKETHILHGKKDDKEATLYAPGEEIELTEKEAARLSGNVEPKAGKAKKE
jgi:hypothetical protein